MEDAQASGPLFAVGIWRSGTSLIHALLNQNPEIALLYEGDLPLLNSFFVVPGGKKHWPDRWEFWNKAVTRHQFDSATLPLTFKNATEATRAVYQSFALGKGATVWGEKSPTLYVELSKLSAQFPDARFLIIWRSPLGFLDSMFRAAEGSLWFRKRGMPLRALLGMREMKRQRDELVRRDVPVHEIYYEELTRDPDPVMRGICEFLQIPFDARMISLADADRSSVHEGKHHENVKSGEIVQQKRESRAIPPELQAKAERYLNLWKRESAGQWPRYPAKTNPAAGLPGFTERTRDWVLFRVLRTFDFMVLILYSFAPIPLLQKYRAQKRRRAGMRVAPSGSLSEGSADATVRPSK